MEAHAISSGSTLSREGLAYLRSRGIEEEVAAQYGLWDRKAGRGGNWLVTPFLIDGQVVNNKYRLYGDGTEKRFFMDEGAPVILWNQDILEDPALEDPANPLVITEGEMDALSVIQAEHPWVVSVPNGASKGETQQLQYLTPEVLDKLRRVARYVIATDDDAAGHALRQALVEALSLPRCYVPSYGGEKDFNDLLRKHGPEAVRQAIRDAEPIPYQGAYYAWQFPPFEDFEKWPTGVGDLDNYLQLFSGSFTVITGVPGTGKSLFTQNLCYNLAYQHGLKVVLGSFENRPPQVINKLKQMYAHSKILTPEQEIEARMFVNSHFYFVVTDAPNVRQLDESPVETDLAWFLDAAATFVIREGAKVVVLDPWNQISHRRGKGEDTYEYVERALMEITRFASRFNLIVIVVAHPHKIEFEKSNNWFRKVNLYDISGSAAWYNKPDFGITLHRPGDHTLVGVDIAKVRMEGTGKVGVTELRWIDDRCEYRDASGM